jgi:membrane fusion protein, multidrug efflux system
MKNPFLLLPLAVLLAAGAGLVTRPCSAQQATSSPQPQAVPVIVGKVGRQDVPIDARGLGTVQAWRSFTARAQVTGYLTQINFREGQQVKQGDLLALIDPRPYAALLAQAQAKKAGDQATLDNDQLNYRRDSALAHDQYASRQQADNDMALVRQYQANVLGDDAAIMQAQLNLEFCRITAPIDGVVGFRLVDIGNLIESGAQTAIVTIQQIHPIAVVFTLPEQDLPDVEVALTHGQPPVLAFTADEQTELDRGALLTPNNSIDTSTGTISLKAIFQNPQNKLWPGQYVNAHLQLRIQHDAVTLPVAAVQHGPDGLYVYLAKPDNTVRNQPITVSYQNEQVAVVSKGLNGGEAIVLDGQSRLQDGTRIEPKQAAASPQMKS